MTVKAWVSHDAYRHVLTGRLFMTAISVPSSFRICYMSGNIPSSVITFMFVLYKNWNTLRCSGHLPASDCKSNFVAGANIASFMDELALCWHAIQLYDLQHIVTSAYNVIKFLISISSLGLLLVRVTMTQYKNHTSENVQNIWPPVKSGIYSTQVPHWTGLST